MFHWFKDRSIGCPECNYTGYVEYLGDRLRITAPCECREQRSLTTEQTKELLGAAEAIPVKSTVEALELYRERKAKQ